MNNYRRGYVSERLAFKELEEECFTCFRTAGSHTLYDIIAINDRLTRCIQLKRVKGKYYSFKTDMKNIKKHKVHDNCSKELWIRLDRMKGRKTQWKKLVIT